MQAIDCLRPGAVPIIAEQFVYVRVRRLARIGCRPIGSYPVTGAVL